MSTTTSRRLFLAKGSAATVLTALRASIAEAEGREVDPIFAAIGRHKEAERAYGELCRIDDNERDWVAHAGAEEREQEAREALLATPPENSFRGPLRYRIFRLARRRC